MFVSCGEAGRVGVVTGRLSPEDLLRDWPAVEATLDALFADGRHGEFLVLLRDAVAATQLPDGKSEAELAAVAAYHSRITHSTCRCGVCSR